MENYAKFIAEIDEVVKPKLKGCMTLPTRSTPMPSTR